MISEKNEGPLEWTGERYVPWMDPGEIHYEHLHRYRFAKEFVKGKKVLDLACGEGYGSDLLAEEAEKVVGIDIDELTIRHASSRYLKENLEFIVGSITRIPIEGERLFDVVVCFEGLEHIEAHDEFMGEVKRLLREDGLFIVSTPNRYLYSDQPRYQNPFHLRELYLDEFKQLLKIRFKHSLLYGQQVYATSNLFSLLQHSGPTRHFVIDKKDREYIFVRPDMRKAKYFIGVASDTSLDLQRTVGDSYLLDNSDSLFLYRSGQVAHLEGVIKERENGIEQLRVTLEEKESILQELRRTASRTEKDLSELRELARQKEEEADQFKLGLDGKTMEVSALSELARQKEEEVDQLKLGLDGKTKEVSALGELARQKAEEVDQIKLALDGKTMEVSALGELARQKAEEVDQIKLALDGRTKEVSALSELARQKAKEVDQFKLALYEKTKEVSALSELVRQQAEKVDRLKLDLGEQAIDLASLSEALSRDERLIETQRKSLIKKDNQITALESHIAQRDSILGELTRAVDAKQEVIDSLNERLEGIAHQVLDLETKLHGTESTLIRIYDSDGWKALLKYYQLRNALLPPDSKRSGMTKFVLNKILRRSPAGQPIQPQDSPTPKKLSDRDEAIKISVIIVHYKNEKLTMDCIRSLLEGDYPSHRYEILLVNNGAEADYARLAEAFCGQGNIRILNSGKNLGFAAGCNLGIRASRGGSVLLLNNDTVVPRNFLSDYVSMADSYPDFAILGTKIRFMGEEGLINNAGGFLSSLGDGGDIGYRERDVGQYDYKREVFSICGANMLIRREVFDQIGLLDEKFFLYYEDVDFCYRARLHGLKILHVPEPSILHHHAASSGEWSPLFTFYVFRNKLFLHLKNSNIRLLTRVVACHFARMLQEVLILRTRQKIHLKVTGSLIRHLPYLLWNRLKIRMRGKKVRDSAILNYVDKIPKRKNGDTAVKDIVLYNRYLDTLGGGELSTALLAKGLSDIFTNAKIHLVTFNQDWNIWGRTSVKHREDLEKTFKVKLCDRVVVHRIKTLFETRNGNGNGKGKGKENAQGPSFEGISGLRLKTHLCLLNWKLRRRARKSDLFLNHSFADEFIPRAKESVYLCMFPHPPHQRDFMRHYTKLVGISEFTIKHINQRWNCKADLLYPYAYDAVPGYRDFSQRENIILNIGRFFSDGHNKRQDVAIHAFKGLKDGKRINGWKLILIGRCAKKDEWFLEKMKEEARGYDITFLTELSEKEKLDLMEKAKIFVHATGYGTSEENLPELMEHFGISVVEAKTHGLVPIVIGKGGLTELVHHGQDGFLFNDAEDLMEKISMCANGEDLLRALSINAYRESIQKFDYTTYLEHLKRILRK